MSYAICRVQKIKGSSGIAGCQIHNRREKKSRTNPDINREKSHLNIELIDTKGKTFNELVEERLKEGYKVKKALRKDAVKLCEFLFTSDAEFFDKLTYEQQIDYFRDCLTYVQITYGAENVIAATIHLDEATPHLHLDFVPLHSDGRLSANQMFNGKIAMQKLQDHFHHYISEKWGLERGHRSDLSVGEKPRKNKSVQQLKKETDYQISANNRVISKQNCTISDNQQVISNQNQQIADRNAEINRLQALKNERERACKAEKDKLYAYQQECEKWASVAQAGATTLTPKFSGGYKELTTEQIQGVLVANKKQEIELHQKDRVIAELKNDKRNLGNQVSSPLIIREFESREKRDFVLKCLNSKDLHPLPISENGLVIPKWLENSVLLRNIEAEYRPSVINAISSTKRDLSAEQSRNAPTKEKEKWVSR